MNASNGSAPTSSVPSRISERLSGKVAAVTGASSGLGRAVAIAYAAEGAVVVCADLAPVAKVHVREDDVKATHEVIIERGSRSIFVRCDVGDSQSVQDLVKATVQEYGRLDIMVNNAGIAAEADRPIHETDDETFDLTMRVNSRGVFLGCKYAGKQMIQQDPHPSGDRGWIINTASVLGLVGFAGAVSYTASKGSVVQMTKTVALDYAPYRIHCNAICPGFTNTAMTKPMTDTESVGTLLAAGHPFKGIGEPEDIAKAAVFLASDDASWITGIPLPVDGGYVAR